MEPIQLSPRLQQIAQWVQKGSSFADIGTDHGYLPLYLLQNKQITSAIATDLRENPLASAKRASESFGLPLTLRLCDGLSSVLPEEVDTIAIAGMGGETILQILEAWHRNWTGRFLLQPMSTQFQLRVWLNQNNYTILRERTIMEGETLYTTMEVVVGAEPPLSLGELLVGKQDDSDENRPLLIQNTIIKKQKALQGASKAQDSEQRKAQLEAELIALKTMERDHSK